MKKNKRFYFPILLKVILLGIITSFVAATVSIIVSYNNMINKATKDMEESAIDALEYAHGFFDSPTEDYKNLNSFKYIHSYVEPIYQNALNVKDATLENYPSFEEYEYVFLKAFPYFYTDEMFMTLDYPTWRENYNTLNQILLNASFYCEQPSYFAYKDKDDPNRLVFLFDSRHATSKTKNVFYHCPGSHYDIKDNDSIVDLGHEYIQEFNLGKYHTRYFPINATNDDDELETIGYMFIEYQTKDISSAYQPILRNEILILSATSLIVILFYALLSYLMFVRNINRLNKTAEGVSHKLGTGDEFEVIDPNINSHDEISTLSNSFVAMENQIVNYVGIIQASAREKERMNAELEVASKIQLEALPSSHFDDEKTSIRTYIKPAKEVGGDFYDYFYINDNELAIIVSDVSGKGIPASLFMMKSKELIKSKLLGGTSLVNAVKEVNDILTNNNDESLFVTSFIGVINFAKKEIRFVNAGHEKPYIISNKSIIKLDGNANFVLGAVEEATFIEEKHAFNKGDIIFLYTDGLNESINNKEEEFTYQRIEESLSQSLGSSLNGYIDNMIDALSTFTSGQEPFDDVTMFIMRYNDGELKLSYNKKDLSIITDIVDKFNEHYSNLSNEIKSKVGIIIDELVNNLVSYEKREDLIIEIRFVEKNGGLHIEIISNGDDYNPFEKHEEKYLDDYSDDIKEGGFGISIVKDFSRSTSYEYKDGKSIVTIEL